MNLMRTLDNIRQDLKRRPYALLAGRELAVLLAQYTIAKRTRRAIERRRRCQNDLSDQKPSTL